MLRQIIKVTSTKSSFNIQASFSTSLLCTSQKNELPPVKNWDIETLDPIGKIKRCTRRDMALLKDRLTFWKEKKNEAINDEGRVIDWDHPTAPIFPNHCDIVIIGGGVIGCSIAYHLKKKGKKDFRVVVVEKDPTYKVASTVLSVGGLRQQFSLEENIEMSVYGAEFIRNINDHLGIKGQPPIDVQFHPYGYLTLASEEQAELLMHNSKLQNSLGAKNVILSKNQLKSRFPWLNVDNIECGCVGLEKEGWFDPWLLLNAFRNKALEIGVDIVAAEAKGFNFQVKKDTYISGEELSPVEELEYLVVETEDKKLRDINFSRCIIAAGAFSGEIARMAKIGAAPGIRSVPLPVEPRKRYVYCVHAPEGPGLNTPMTIDPTGAYFRREGLANHYICGLCPTPDKEPPIDNLDVDYEFFNTDVWPILANRVKGFENLKVKSAWSGFYEYNTYDENGIIGFHPYHDNLLFATGFSGHGIQHAPAVGRAMMELIAFGRFRTIDLNRLSFERFITLEPMREHNIW